MASLKQQAAIKYDFGQLGDIIPRYKSPKTWITSIRVTLLFTIPLLFGALLGQFNDAFTLALASGMLALADPRGSTERRSVTILFAAGMGTIMISVGQFLGNFQLGILILASALGFMMGMLNNFGTSGVRSGFFITTCSFMGATGGTLGPLLSWQDILPAATWCLAVALLFFQTKPIQKRSLKNRLLDFRLNIVAQLKMKTPIGRMAYREMIAAGLSVIAILLMGRNNPEWAATAALALFWPTSPVLYKRGARFIIATIIAVIISFFIITLVSDLRFIAGFVGLALFSTTAMRETNYAAFSFTNTLFYILMIMLASGVGGIAILGERLFNVFVGISIAMIVATFTLPAKERLALLYEMDLPLPLSEHIDDPFLARLRTRQVISGLYRSDIVLHLLEVDRFMRSQVKDKKVKRE
ncbi:MAG: FUSC family protein [Coriobacteriia bacterium]|nr:FUSC family protein [Coriobacteriia bacterium]